MDKDKTEGLLQKEEGVKRTVGGGPLTLTNVAAIILSLFTLYTAFFGMIDAIRFRSFHLFLAFVITLLMYPAVPRQKRKVPFWDYLIVALSMVSTGYFVAFSQELNNRIFFVTPLTPTQFFVSIALTLILLEATRRVVGWLLPGVAFSLILYALIGDKLPASLGHPGFDFSTIIEQLSMTSEGIFGSVLGIVATYVAMFVLLASFLDISGTGPFFIDLALSGTGGARGGPAKTAIIASGLFGTISGSAVANVVSTGTFTIPLMKGVGYRPQFAGAVEAVASTGGQLMPPVMAATAFVMADLMGVPYLRVCGAALIPALLYYFAIYVMVDREALKTGLRGLQKAELPSLPKVLRKWYLSLPLVVIIYALIVGYSPMAAGLYAWIVTLPFVFLTNWKNLPLKLMMKAMENGSKNLMSVTTTCACAGIIVGIIILTGLGLKISGLIITLSHGSLFLALILTALTCMILGMGLPTLPAYLVSVSIMVPALIKLGIQPIQAHMFVFYFSIISCITPPVAIAAYAAGGIAKTDPMGVGWEAVKLGVASYLIPFIFAYQPVLLLEGQFWDIILAGISAIVGIVALGCAVVGYINTQLNRLERLCLSLGAILLIIPGLATDIIGLGLSLIPYFTQRARERRIGEGRVVHTS